MWLRRTQIYWSANAQQLRATLPLHTHCREIETRAMRWQFIAALAVMASVLARWAEGETFTMRTITFVNGNEGYTSETTQADIKSCVCVYFDSQPIVNNTNENSTKLEVSCPLSSNVAFTNLTQEEKCFADTNECDVTQGFGFVGNNNTALTTAYAQAIQSNYTGVLRACPYRIARVVVGNSMDRPVETTPVITGFILTLTLGYLGFSVVLFASFCIVQRLMVGKD